MIKSMDELIGLIDSYHTWAKRLFAAGVVVLACYGGYKYGYDQGMNRAFDYVQKHVDEICKPDEASSQSSLPATDGQPGKMWESEALLPGHVVKSEA
jgi:hypothetical protein